MDGWLLRPAGVRGRGGVRVHEARRSSLQDWDTKGACFPVPQENVKIPYHGCSSLLVWVCVCSSVVCSRVVLHPDNKVGNVWKQMVISKEKSVFLYIANVES